MKSAFLTGIALLFSISVICQNLTQTVRGSIKDVDSRAPLIGATVIVTGFDPVKGTITDVDGDFRLENIPIGRISLLISYIGYEAKTISSIVVTSGKEVVLDLELQESATKMEEIVITAGVANGEAMNEMAMVSSRSISSEIITRIAGSFNDPSRIVSNYAGVAATQDGSNDVIVRGNSPKYVQWRLEGVEITNPNHFGDQSSVGGSISSLNNNLLSTSDFYTGAFSPEYGDVLSGVYDVKLRAGNNEQTESVFGFGLLGTDLTMEGPFKKGYDGSYLVNYRFSTASMIQDLGLLPDEVNGVPKFQDAAFKATFPTKRAGYFSLFGLGGYSSVLFKDVTPALWNTPGDRAMADEVREDFDKKSFLVNVGLNHTFTINKNSFINSTIAYSMDGIEDQVFELQQQKIYDENGQYLRDSTVSNDLNFNGRLMKTTYRAATTYHHKFGPKSKIQVGSKFAMFGYDYEQSRFDETPADRQTLVDFDENISTLRNFVSWKYRLTEDLTVVSGVHNMNVLYNSKSTLEPRVAVNWQMSDKSSIHAGYGKHSTMESVHNYFAKVDVDGNLIEPNRNLGLLKANHYVLGFKQQVAKNVTATVELYYQDLYDLPVENNDTSYYATINEGLEFRYIDLVNKGTGKNYGVEVTVERPFLNNYYFMVNGSLYQSKYKALEGVERNTQYNGNYLANVIFGKEVLHLGRNNNQTLGFNAKIFFGGGRKIIPLLRDESGSLTVDADNNQYWDYSKAYEHSIEDVHSVIVSINYKWDKPKATHELFLNLDNLTNTKGKLGEYYDESEPNSVGYLRQFGFFPNLMYRVYF
ncbi:MAG: TonB-dependent receptor [Cyclobacteriaceae bacterium]